MVSSDRVSAWHQGARNREGAMAKRHGRPSVQYRYEHYDPWM